MKILPILLINLVVTGGALVIYDQMHGESAGTTYAMGGADPVEIEDIKTRIARLESSGDQPALAGGADASVLSRLEALERREVGGTRRPVSDGPEGEGPAAGSHAGPVTTFSEEGDISDAEVSRFRKLMDAAREQQRLEREREQLANLLERLEISMDDKQQEQYLGARRERQRKIGELFRGMRRDPDVDREQVMEQINAGRAKIHEEFAVTLNKFLPSGDAAKLAEHEGNSRWGSMRRGGGGRRGDR